MAKKKVDVDELEAPAELSAPEPDHTALHGTESIIDPTGERSYYIKVDGQRYVHVGEHNGQWVYRPD